MKKETKKTNEVGLCTVKIKWQNPDDFICIYPLKIGIMAIDCQSVSRIIIKKQVIAKAKKIIDNNPELFDSPNKEYKFSVSIKMHECDFFIILDEADLNEEK